MPNWCENNLRIYGDKEDLDAFKAAVSDREHETDLSFNKLSPQPEGLEEKTDKDDTGMPTWYAWRLVHWGCKWDVDADLIDENDVFVEYQFMSPWAPPVPWIAKAAMLYPKLHFVLKYDEPGMCFTGVAIAKDGKLVKDETIEY